MFSKWSGLLVFGFVTAVIFVQGHNHEAPHLKYSREVNEQEVARGKVHSHVHDHEHNHAGCGNDHGHKHAHDHHQDHKNVISDLFDHYHYKLAADEKFVPYAADSYLSFLNDPTSRLWTYAISSVLLISAFPCFVLAFIPIQANTSKNSFFLKILLAFGAGGLLGDAFLHLIPHASGGHDHGHSHVHGHDHHHSHSHDEEDHDHVHDMSTGFWVLGGLLAFFVVEKFVRIVRGEDNHCHGHTHVHSHSPNTKKKNLKLQGEESDDEKSEASVKKDKVLKNRPTKKEGEKKKVTPVEIAVLETPRIRVAAYLNLAADFMHNFTDGLAIGASFIAGTAVGLVTTATVLFHEVPHEIGDFAILVQSGYSKKRAMFTQLLTALGALLGCVISLWSVDAAALAEAAQSSWVLPFTAGGFIYIATVSVIPELLEKSSLLLSILEVVALSAGVFAMYVVALFE